MCASRATLRIPANFEISRASEVSTDTSPDRISRALSRAIANCNMERFHPHTCAIYT
jgi:hypothetical protein